MATKIQTIENNQLLVTMSDVSLLPSVKKAISLMRGVSMVSARRTRGLSRFEKSRLDIKAGRVFEANNVDELFEQLNS